MKKIILLVFALLSLGLTACGGEKTIKVYSRDTTSGTRDGFFSTIGFKDAVSDNTKLVSGAIADIADNGTMINYLKNDVYGIGYISLASLEESGLKGLDYNGVKPTVENVVNGTYKLTRNFNYVTRAEYDSEDKEAIIKAFVAFLSTKDAKTTIKSKHGIIDVKSTDKSWDDIKADYPIAAKDNSAITIKFGGSTSCLSIAKALSSEFSKKCGNFKIEHNHVGSSDAFKKTQGKDKASASALDFGYASREFSSSETYAANTAGKLCTDAIVAAVNKDNKVSSITTEVLKKIYNGSITKWSEVE